MAWIESHQRLQTDPEMLRLAGDMGWSVPECIGRLHLFWWWCVDHAETGDLRRCNNAMLALAVGLNPSEGKRFVDAMVGQEGHGFIERQPYFRVRNWWKFHGYRLTKKYARIPSKAEEVRKLYEQQTVTQQVHSVPVAGIQQVHSVPQPTGTNITEPTPHMGAGSLSRRKPANIEECVAMGDRIGVGPQQARTWYADMEASNWSKMDGTPFGNWPREMAAYRDRIRANGHAPSKPQSLGPTLKEVSAYAVEKDPEAAAYAVSWHEYWRKKDWKRKDGTLIDWKVEFSIALTKRKTETVA